MNRNTSEINVPECRRPADPYIERKSVCLTGIFFNLEVKLGEFVMKIVSRRYSKLNRAHLYTDVRDVEKDLNGLQ